MRTRSPRAGRRLPRFDRLETRRLMSVGFDEVLLPTIPSPYGTIPTLLARASDDTVWTVGFGPYNANYELQRTDAHGVTTAVTGLPPGDVPADLLAGPNGSIWLVTASNDGTSGHVVKFSTLDLVVSPLPDPAGRAALGPDGNLWIAVAKSNLIEEFNVKTETVTTFSLPDKDGVIADIISGPDGNLWFSEPATHRLGKITTVGSVTEYPVGVTLSALAPGTDGNVWFGANDVVGHPLVGRVTPDGATRTFDVASPLHPYYSYYGNVDAVTSLAAAPDGAMWFTIPNRATFGRFGMDGSIESYPLPDFSSKPDAIAPDGHGGFDFLETRHNALGHLDVNLATPGVSVTAVAVQPNAGTVSKDLTVAKFNSPEPAASASDFEVRFQAVGASPLSARVVDDGSGGFLVKVDGAYTYSTASSLFSVTVFDARHEAAQGINSTAIGATTAENPPLTIAASGFTAYVGVPVTDPIGTFHDPQADRSDYPTISVDWGDGTPVGSAYYSHLAWPPPAGENGSLGGQHQYATKGIYTVTLSVEQAGVVSVATETATVVDAPPILNIYPNSPTAYVNKTAKDYVAEFAARDPNAQASDFVATIDWGDGTSSQGAIEKLQGASFWPFGVKGEHTYTTLGNFNQVVTVNGANFAPYGSRNASSVRNVTTGVSSVYPQSAFETAGQSPTLYLGYFFFVSADSKAGDFAATIDWGDGSTGLAQIAGQDGSYSVTGQHAYGTVGTDTVQVHIIGPAVGGVAFTSQLTTTVTVLEPLASLTPVGATPSVGLIFSGSLARLQFGPSGLNRNDFASIDWGDGSTSPGEIQSDAAGGFDVVGYHNYYQGGDYPIRVSIDYGSPYSNFSAVAAVTTSLTIQASPIATLTPTIGGFSQGKESRGRVATFTTTDPNAISDNYNAIVSWMGGGHADAEIARVSPGVFDVWVLIDFAFWGDLPVEVVAFPKGGAKVSVASDAFITPPPLSATAAPIFAEVGNPITPVVASFTSTDRASKATDFAATIDWGDGTTSGGTVAAVTKDYVLSFIVTGSHQYASVFAGPAKVSIRNVGDIGPDTLGAILPTTATVSADRHLTLSAVVPTGLQQSRTDRVRVASFTSDDPAATTIDYVSSLDWAGGGHAPTDILADGAGGFDVWATITPSTWGTLALTVTASGRGGKPATAGMDTTVTPASITSAISPSVTRIVNLPSTGSFVAFASFNPGAVAADFAASIQWGDGSTTDASVLASGQQGFYVEGTHTFGRFGDFPASVTIFNVGAGGTRAVAATLASTIHINTPPSTFATVGVTAQAVVGVDWSGAIAYFTSLNTNAMPADFTATLVWGDGSPASQARIIPLGNGSFEVEAEHIFAVPGNRTATVLVVAASGETNSQVSDISVLPGPIDAIGTRLEVAAGAAASGVVATFRDDPASPATRYSATIDWGDGAISPGTVSSYLGEFVVYASHLYAAAGSHSFRVSIQRDNGTSAAASGTANVAAAPAPGPTGTPAPSGPVGGVPESDPTVVSVTVMRGKAGVAGIRVLYSGNPRGSIASDPSRYTVIEAGKDGKFGTKDDRVVKFKATAFNVATHSVTLTPKGHFARTARFRVTFLGNAGTLMVASSR